jgi:flagellar biosynthesis protein FlhG
MSGGTVSCTIREVAQQTGLEESRIRFFERAFPEFFERSGDQLTSRTFGERQVAVLHDVAALLEQHRNNLSAVRAELLRRHPPPSRALRIITVTSGKGGVGKSTVALNLALAMVRRGTRTLLFDADLGLANLHVLAGVSPRATLIELLNGDATMDEIVLPGPGGLKVVCGGSGIAGLADLKSDFVSFLGRELQKMGSQFDAIVIDTAAGIAAHVLHFVRLADEVAVVATPQLASTLDAYSLIKVARQEQVPGRLGLLINQAADPAQADHVYGKISSCARQFLGFTPERWGHLLRDPLLELSTQRREPYLLAHPQGENARLLEDIAGRLTAQLKSKVPQLAEVPA